MSSNQPQCAHCQRGADKVPLFPLQYQGEDKWICPQHLPILIHRPALLADKFPGMEIVDTPEGQGH
jgi:hypothetical protein